MPCGTLAGTGIGFLHAIQGPWAGVGHVFSVLVTVIGFLPVLVSCYYWKQGRAATTVKQVTLAATKDPVAGRFEQVVYRLHSTCQVSMEDVKWAMPNGKRGMEDWQRFL